MSCTKSIQHGEHSSAPKAQDFNTLKVQNRKHKQLRETQRYSDDIEWVTETFTRNVNVVSLGLADLV